MRSTMAQASATRHAEARICQLVLAWLFFGLAISGCAHPALETRGISGWQAHPQTQCFSPDSQWMAYALNQRVFHELRRYRYDPFGHHWYSVPFGSHDCRLGVEWVKIQDPAEVRSVNLGHRQPYRKIIALRFSPDSSRLAVLERDRITTIELASRRAAVARLEDDSARAITWIGNTKQAYLTGRGLWHRQAKGSSRGDMVLSLGPLTPPGSAPPPSSRDSSSLFPDAFVSLGGRYIVTYRIGLEGPCPVWVVDAQEARVMELTLSPHHFFLDGNDISWNPDETAMAIGPYVGKGPVKVPVWLIDLEQWTSRDVTPELLRLFGGQYYACPHWSSGGQYWKVPMEGSWAEVSPVTWEFKVRKGRFIPGWWNEEGLKLLYRRTTRLDVDYEGGGGGAGQPLSPCSRYLAVQGLDRDKGQAHLSLYEMPAREPISK